MTDLLIMAAATAGTLFILLAGIGMVRMPDLYLRISVTTKAATLGVGLILAGTAFYFNEAAVTTRVLAIILFILLTAPVGAHLLGRSSYFIGIKLWNRSVRDDLEGKYNKKTHKLNSGEEEDNDQD